MVKRGKQRGKASSPAGDGRPPNLSQLTRRIRHQIDIIYLQVDTQLTNLARIQLQLDDVRAKIHRL